MIGNFASHPSFLVANHTSVDLGTPSQITASNLLLLQDGVQSLPLWMVIMSNAGVKYPYLYWGLYGAGFSIIPGGRSTMGIVTLTNRALEADITGSLNW